MREVERVVMLRTVDENWMTHIDSIDQLKYGVGLRAYGHKDPVVEYKFEAFNMFDSMISTIQDEALRRIYSVKIAGKDRPTRQKVTGEGREVVGESGPREKKPTKSKPATRTGSKIGPNDLCPCGSGKKYKKCCGND